MLGHEARGARDSGRPLYLDDPSWSKSAWINPEWFTTSFSSPILLDIGPNSSPATTLSMGEREQELHSKNF